MLKEGRVIFMRNFVFFVSLRSNVPFVLKEALRMVENGHKVSVFFDLDGARVLDKNYVKVRKRNHNVDLDILLQNAVDKGIKLFGCQMNVLIADGLELIDGAELAGVVTFLEKAYEADAVLSY